MKQNVSPGMFAAVIAVALVIVGVIMWRVWVAPSSIPAPGSEKATANPRAGGGPTAEAFRQRDEWNRTHPGAKGSGPGGNR